MSKQLTLEIADPNQPASIEVAGADLAKTIACLEGESRVVEAVDRVGQSRYRLQHRRGWVASTWSRCPASTPTEKGRKVYASNLPPSHAPLAGGQLTTCKPSSPIPVLN